MNHMTAEKKITKATFKSFIKNNRENLFILVESRFDGMTDGIEMVRSVPTKIQAEDHAGCIENNLGIKGVWLVGQSRDYFKAYEDPMFKGFHVSNCCGSFKIGIIK